MLPEARPLTVPRFRIGDDLLASRLNQGVDAINAISQGVSLGVDDDGEPYAIDIPAQYTRARAVITDSNVSLAGELTFDGVALKNGDYVLIATGGTPGVDSLRMVSATSPWPLIARLNYSQAGIGPVIPHGTLISVWGGTAGKGQIYMASFDTFVTF